MRHGYMAQLVGNCAFDDIGTLINQCLIYDDCWHSIARDNCASIISYLGITDKYQRHSHICLCREGRYSVNHGRRPIICGHNMVQAFNGGQLVVNALSGIFGSLVLVLTRCGAGLA